MNNECEFFLKAEEIRKSFRIGQEEIAVLRSVSFNVSKGEWIALLGASGSGKTTLLDILGSISKPDAGRVIVDGTDYNELSRNGLIRFRRKNVGFVFQAYHILPELNILLEGMPRKAAKEKALHLLEKVGLSHRLTHRRSEMSGGEQQRCAIARALINDPQLLLADEPTGNLDSVTGKGILDLFLQLKEETDTTIIMVTHDRQIAGLSDRIIELRDGVIYNEELQS